MKFTPTHLDKVYWEQPQYTKGDLIDYYEKVAPFILPYLKNRPIVMHRYPNGIKGEQFYQKQIGSHPNWIKTFTIEHENRAIEYLLIDSVDALLYAVNLGSIDLNPFMSTIKKLEYPTYAVIDLDPVAISFDAVIEVALAIHSLLDDLKIKNFCKTSGGRGLHLYIPLHNRYSFEQVAQFTKIIALKTYEELPTITSLERSPRKREKKVYIDILQNRAYQTICAPYSVRPRPFAPVATPLHWEEVKNGLDPKTFTMKTTLNRLNEIGDIFKPTLTYSVNLLKLFT